MVAFNREQVIIDSFNFVEIYLWDYQDIFGDNSSNYSNSEYKNLWNRDVNDR